MLRKQERIKNFDEELMFLEKEDKTLLDIRIRSIIVNNNCINEDIIYSFICNELHNMSYEDDVINGNCLEIKNLARHYKEKNENWEFGENLACVISFVTTLIIMLIDCGIGTVEKIKDCDLEKQYILWHVIIMLIAVLAWGFIYEKKKCDDLFFRIFNRTAPTVTMVSLLIFYTMQSANCLLVMWIIPILTFIITFYCVFYKYKELKKHR